MHVNATHNSISNPTSTESYNINFDRSNTTVMCIIAIMIRLFGLLWVAVAMSSDVHDDNSSQKQIEVGGINFTSMLKKTLVDNCIC